MAKLKYGERSETGDIVSGILSGGISGYGEAQARDQAMKDKLMETILTEGIKQKLQSQFQQENIDRLTKSGILGGGGSGAYVAGINEKGMPDIKFPTPAERDKMTTRAEAPKFLPALAYTRQAISKGANPNKLIPELSSRYNTEGQIKDITDISKTAGLERGRAEKLRIQRQGESDIKNIGESVMKGLDSPMMQGGGMSGKAYQLRGYIDKEGPKRGFNLAKAQLDWMGMQQLTKTMNQNQMVGLQMALKTSEADLVPMRGLNDEFKRVDFTPVNKVIIGARLKGVGWMDESGRKQSGQIPQYELDPKAMKGMSQDQVQVATKFITQLNLMKDNLAVAFMRGGVPSDQAFKLTDKVLSPAYGSKSFASALDQIEVNFNIRNTAIDQMRPYTVGGGYGGGNMYGGSPSLIPQAQGQQGNARQNNNDPLGIRQ